MSGKDFRFLSWRAYSLSLAPTATCLLEVSLLAVPYEHFRAIFKDLYLLIKLYACCQACQAPEKRKQNSTQIPCNELPHVNSRVINRVRRVIVITVIQAMRLSPGPFTEDSVGLRGNLLQIHPSGPDLAVCDFDARGFISTLDQ